MIVLGMLIDGEGIRASQTQPQDNRDGNGTEGGTKDHS
jgi:hypothetical protein